MVNNVVAFRGPRTLRQPIAHFLRVGDSGHRKLAALRASGDLAFQRVVVDAPKLSHQRVLIDAFQADGAEIVLDTRVAELAAPAKVGGMARHAPWALDGNALLGPDHFDPARSDTVDRIARFAVEQRVNAVLAPGHHLGDPRFGGWLDVDARACVALREALDREGGRHVGIDYSLIAPRTTLERIERRGDVVARLIDLPFDNLWIRATPYGSDAGPLVQRRFIEALSGLHNVGKPVVVDHVDGLAGAALVAFGVAGGIAHGIGERGRFNAADWHKTPKERDPDDGFGRQKRIAVAGLDRSFTKAELRTLVSARGARSLVVCQDRGCCARGLEDMIRDPRRHAARLSLGLMEELAAVPDALRAGHLVNGHVADAARLADRMRRLKPLPATAEQHGVDPASLAGRLDRHCHTREKIHDALENLLDERGDELARSRPVIRRSVADGTGIIRGAAA